MKSDRFYVATVASDAAQVAEEYNIGIEIDEFCTASNMDDENFKTRHFTLKCLFCAAEIIILSSGHMNKDSIKEQNKS